MIVFFESAQRLFLYFLIILLCQHRGTTTAKKKDLLNFTRGKNLSLYTNIHFVFSFQMPLEGMLQYVNNCSRHPLLHLVFNTHKF